MPTFSGLAKKTRRRFSLRFAILIANAASLRVNPSRLSAGGVSLIADAVLGLRLPRDDPSLREAEDPGVCKDVFSETVEGVISSDLHSVFVEAQSCPKPVESKEEDVKA
ncbi:hypothetical protein E4U61_004126 [Claviceps capensis]|nr:hypothetical protein E4U61_004126 [Claviceps capensis]